MGSFPAGLRCVLCVPARGGIRTIGASFTHHAGAGFRPSKVVVVAKTTRYEFEQQRYRYAGLSEDDLKELLALKGSNYSGLLERHNIHTRNVQHVINSLRATQKYYAGHL